MGQDSWVVLSPGPPLSDRSMAIHSTDKKKKRARTLPMACLGLICILLATVQFLWGTNQGIKLINKIETSREIRDAF